jgi:hypothetical protein
MECIGQFERVTPGRSVTDSATEQKAMKVIAAFAAWEYSLGLLKSVMRPTSAKCLSVCPKSS